MPLPGVLGCLASLSGPLVWQCSVQGSSWAEEANGGDLPAVTVPEVPCQLPIEALNPVAAVTVGLRQAEHSPASFPATPD